MAAADAATAAADAAAEAITAQETFDAADMAANTAQTLLNDAQDDVDVAQIDVDEAQEVVQIIVDEIEGTEEFVANLDEDLVFALNRSLHPAVQTDLLPLDIDLDLLSRITAEDLGNGEIQALTRGFRFQERFNRKAADFAAQGKTQQAEFFSAKADEMLAKNLARVDGPAGKSGAGAADAAVAAASGLAAEAANAAAGEAASEIAKEQPGRAAGEAAAEIAKQNGRRP